MNNTTEEQLILKLKELKEIKPNKEWVSSLKSQILAEKQVVAETVSNPATEISFMTVLGKAFFQKRIVYSLATMAFVIVGVIGFAQYTMPGDLLFPIKKISEHSQVALTGQASLNQDIKVFNNRISDLVVATEKGKDSKINSAISEVSANAIAIANNLKDNPVDELDIDAIKDSLKVLSSVFGTDLTEIPEVKGLYQITVERKIIDLEKRTLTEEQEEALLEAKELNKEGKYVEALEKLLLIRKAIINQSIDK